jgi:hypothetical protein
MDTMDSSQKKLAWNHGLTETNLSFQLRDLSALARISSELGEREETVVLSISCNVLWLPPPSFTEGPWVMCKVV